MHAAVLRYPTSEWRLRGCSEIPRRLLMNRHYRSGLDCRFSVFPTKHSDKEFDDSSRARFPLFEAEIWFKSHRVARTLHIYYSRMLLRLCRLISQSNRLSLSADGFANPFPPLSGLYHASEDNTSSSACSKYTRRKCQSTEVVT